MRNFRYALVAALFGALVAGCSSSAKMTVQQPKTETISSQSTVALDVTAPGDEDSREVAQNVRAALFGRLVSEGLFTQVMAKDQAADYRMVVALSKVDVVSQGARIFFGVLAGSNDLTADVSVAKGQAIEPITKFQVVGASASHPLSSENDMDDAIKELVTKIIEALR
jgi:hypothetical protein